MIDVYWSTYQYLYNLPWSTFQKADIHCENSQTYKLTFQVALLLDGGLTRPTPSTSLIIHSIFILKNSTPIYITRSINNFCLFMNSNVLKVLQPDAFPNANPGWWSGPDFIETPLLVQCWPKLKSNSSDHELEAILYQTSNWYCKRFLG